MSDYSKLTPRWKQGRYPSLKEELKMLGEQENKLVIKDLRADTDRHAIKPTHYTKWAIEPITFIMRNGFEFWRGSAIKYVARAGSKLYDGMDARQSEITDLRKCMRFCEMRINELEGKDEL